MPESVTFQTKPRLAQRMVMRAPAAGCRSQWVLADGVYGGDSKLRWFLLTAPEVRRLLLAIAWPRLNEQRLNFEPYYNIMIRVWIRYLDGGGLQGEEKECLRCE